VPRLERSGERAGELYGATVTRRLYHRLSCAVQLLL
jgi:hypothetical protein